ncbi:portal protein [Sphingomonas sp. SRS2]|uniref:portal protein n=1 Tax=Sphingomonas sp. SRS2 TaxID=133190 RepID=UPI0006184876|nr:portal protein [Sphingomonas sp. SRS2]KKC25824.1 hypothetical protein WP12_12280 [Sphingomonas sp. SRS2]
MSETKAQRLAKLHERALTQFDNVTQATQEERALALQDRRFVSIAGAQWEDEWYDQFENSIRVEINKTASGLEKIVNDYRSNRVTVNFRSTTDTKSTQATAELLDGLFRADVYRSKGQQAFDNAFEEGAAGGYGAWRIVNEFEDEYDPDNEFQRIAIKAIVDADQSVYFDPNAKLYDKSDAMWAIVVTAMAQQSFEEEYEGRCSSWPDSFPKPYYDWYTPDVVKVAEYYAVEDKRDTLIVYRHPLTEEIDKRWKSSMDDDDAADMELRGWVVLKTQQRRRKRVHKYLMSGTEILDDQGYIAGPNIPIVPFYGKRWFIDNMERCRGHVRLAKDPQRVYNAQISKLTEIASVSPIERPILTPAQVKGHEGSWAVANLDRAPYALINPTVDSEGNAVNQGPIGNINPPQVPPVLAALVQVTGSDIAEITNSDDGAEKVKANVSADAMDIAATRVDAKSFTYMDNFRQSMQRCGEIYLGMAREIYVEEGRTVETLGDDGEEGSAVLLESQTDEATGINTIANDLEHGAYKVISDVTEATTTRRDKTVKTMMTVATAAQALGDMETGMAALITGVLNMDGEGMDDFQAYMRKKALGIGLVQPTPEEQQQMAEAAQGQQPSATDQALLAQAKDFEASAGLKLANTEKAVADTGQSKAKTVLTLAQAQETAAKTGQTVEQTKREGILAMRDEAKPQLALPPPQERQAA